MIDINKGETIFLRDEIKQKNNLIPSQQKIINLLVRDQDRYQSGESQNNQNASKSYYGKTFKQKTIALRNIQVAQIVMTYFKTPMLRMANRIRKKFSLCSETENKDERRKWRKSETQIKHLPSAVLKFQVARLKPRNISYKSYKNVREEFLLDFDHNFKIDFLPKKSVFS